MVKGFVRIAAELIEHSADVNALPGKRAKRTTLEGVCEHGRIDTAEPLVRAGIDLCAAQYE